jgi:type II secretory pathway component PulK
MRNGKHKQQGVAYLGLMFVVLFMGMMVGTYIESWSTTAQRERETALLWTGNEYRKAIRNYLRTQPRRQQAIPQNTRKNCWKTNASSPSSATCASVIAIR